MGNTMNSIRRFICVAVLVAAMVQVSFAETHVIDVFNPTLAEYPIASLVAVDFGAVLTGITEVSARISGTGGGGIFECPAGGADGWYDYDIAVYFGGGEFSVSTVNQVAFDEVADLSLFEPNPWEYAEGITSYGVGVTIYAHGPDGTKACSGTNVALPEISHIELTIVAASVVSNSEIPWGTLKAQYSGD